MLFILPECAWVAHHSYFVHPSICACQWCHLSLCLKSCVVQHPHTPTHPIVSQGPTSSPGNLWSTWCLAYSPRGLWSWAQTHQGPLDPPAMARERAAHNACIANVPDNMPDVAHPTFICNCDDWELAYQELSMDANNAVSAVPCLLVSPTHTFYTTGYSHGEINGCRVHLIHCTHRLCKRAFCSGTDWHDSVNA